MALISLFLPADYVVTCHGLCGIEADCFACRAADRFWSDNPAAADCLGYCRADSACKACDARARYYGTRP